MLIDGDATTVVLNGDGVVLVDGDVDVRAIAGHGLVDGVIDSLVDEMVKAFLADVANIHGGTFQHGIQALEHLDVFRRIIAFRILYVWHFVFLFFHEAVGLSVKSSGAPRWMGLGFACFLLLKPACLVLLIVVCKITKNNAKQEII